MALDKSVYPLSRYWYDDGYRFYYAYGNTPAQDFLQNCSGERKPAILVLGCGDIRSCFYSLWKNFDVKSRARFDGVHFILNDISAAVLARNVLFLYLCLQMPEEENKLKWLSGMWAIWYCHELYPDHYKLLHDSLSALCKYSEDWSSANNPLHSLVKFTSPTTLCKIRKMWKMWLNQDVKISSVNEMHISRQIDFMVHSRVLKTEKDASEYVSGSTEIPFEHSLTGNSEKIEAQKSEVLTYCKTGSVYAENVLGLNLPSSPTLVNFTLFEREDGKYSLHYRSMPFSCYYQTVEFTSKQLQSSKGVTPVQLAVKDKYFKSLPYLANSFQQFSLWLKSAHRILKSLELIYFTMDCSHAMTFCYELKGSTKPQLFDLVYTSNLMDHLGPPNLILSAVPLLKVGGLLFTTSLVRDTLSSFLSFLKDCFGFDPRLFSILFGVRCINYEGESYASPVAVRPSPFTIRDMTLSHYEKLQVWEKVQVGTIPLVFDSGQPLTDAVTEALLGCVKVSVYPLLKTPRIAQVANHLCLETAVKVFQTFMSNSYANFSPQFWKPLSDAMQETIKPYLHSMQTQLILHGIHIHLTVTEEDCPICLRVPVSSSIGLYCTRVPIRVQFRTPNFFAAVHKEGFDGAEYLCKIAREGGNVHIFDCVSTSADNSDIIELYFYAPLSLSAEGYKLTLVLVSMTGELAINTVCNMPHASTVPLNSWLIPYTSFIFSQPVVSPLRSFKLPSFGTITSHVSDGNASEVTIRLLDRVVRASVTNKLQPKRVSSNRIQISFGKISCIVTFPFPVDFDKTNITYSRQEKYIAIRCPRAQQDFQEEKPLFITNPDKELSFLSHALSATSLKGLSGQQFTKADRAIQKLYDGDLSQAPALIGLKNTLMYFFQQRDTYYYQFLLPKDGVHGMVLISKRLFDYENRIPVVDLAFCFLEESFVLTVAPVWVNISSGTSCSIKVSDAEYKLLKETFYYFSKRTNAVCSEVTDANSHLHLLTKHGIQKYFSRAVISLLLYDPDVFGQFIMNLREDKQIEEVSTKKQDLVQNAQCDNCRGFFETAKFCSNCRAVKYCTRSCQREHWKTHKHLCKKTPVLQQSANSRALQSFPLARYTYYGDFKYYYAFGNTPAEDFLHSCGGVKEPSVLSLGCGDIRSCFYTLWKNFDSSISNAPKQFNGVHFVLNDCSSPVLARNIVFILLCIQLPKNLIERKKWLSAVWAVWYCHELYPQHQKILSDCLKLLLKYSESVDQWNNVNNPLHNLVRFTSPNVLAGISQVWKAWLKEEIISVEQMRSSRRTELKRCKVYEQLENHATSFVYSSIVTITGDTIASITSKANARIPEVKSYVNSGSCYAETVIGVDSVNSPTTANLTLFERPGGVYTLHYSSFPYSCYHHTVQFSPDSLKESGVEKRLCDGMLVPSESFKLHPLLANSVQQFSMWVQSASAVLNDENFEISFVFNNQHALTFCQELQEQKTTNNQFDVIFSSNLMDHLGPPNVVLSSLPLLASEGLLFTATLLYKRFADTVEEYLSKCFGFDCKYLPIILGTRCINHEGAGYASPVMIQPIPVDMKHFTKNQQQQKVLIWHKNVITQPIICSKLPSCLSGSVTDVLFNSISASAFSLLTGSAGAGGAELHILNNNNIETAILVLQTFFSSVSTSNSYRFWEPLCTSLRRELKPFLCGLQTQALLHDLHIHFMVTEASCPVCKHTPMSEYIALFCAEVPLPLPVPYLTPCFMALIHKYSTSDSQYLCNEAQSGGDVHIIDSIEGTMEGETLKLKFFAPIFFVLQNFKVTIALTWMSQVKNNVTTVLSTTSLKDMQIDFVQYRFQQTAALYQPSSVSCSFGDLVSNVYSEDTVTSEIALSESVLDALTRHNLNTTKISSCEVQLSCGALGFNLKFKYPINYNNVNIKLSRARKIVKITSPRQAQPYEEEKAVFVVYPDHQLSLPPQDLKYEVMLYHSGMQMTQEEKETIEKCSSRDSMSPLARVKETLMFFFQRKNEFHFHLTPYDGKRILGQVLVNRRVFDYEHNAPAVDLAFCFPQDYSYPESIHKAWLSLIEGIETQIVTKIFVDDAEFEELRKVVHYSAKRTLGDFKSAGRNSRYYHLVEQHVEKYFVRAVFYFLYGDPDHKALSGMKDNKSQPEISFPSETCRYCGKFTSDSATKCLTNKIDCCSGDCQSKCGSKHGNTVTESEATGPSRIDAVSGLAGGSVSSAKLTKRQETKCSFCNSSGKLKKCLRCGEAQYCDRECQTKHWSKHKAECRKSAKALKQEYSATKNSSPESSTCCAFCGASSMNLKLCTGCGKVKYCGSECQRKHWKDHNVTCN